MLKKVYTYIKSPFVIICIFSLRPNQCFILSFSQVNLHSRLQISTEHKGQTFYLLLFPSHHLPELVTVNVIYVLNKGETFVNK